MRPKRFAMSCKRNTKISLFCIHVSLFYINFKLSTLSMLSNSTSRVYIIEAKTVQLGSLWIFLYSKLAYRNHPYGCPFSILYNIIMWMLIPLLPLDVCYVQWLYILCVMYCKVFSMSICAGDIKNCQPVILCF